jgi:hypothetical protein
MVNEDDMQKALAEIESSESPNYAAIARKYKLERTTLSSVVRQAVHCRFSRF